MHTFEMRLQETKMSFEYHGAEIAFMINIPCPCLHSLMHILYHRHMYAYVHMNSCYSLSSLLVVKLSHRVCSILTANLFMLIQQRRDSLEQNGSNRILAALLKVLLLYRLYLEGEVIPHSPLLHKNLAMQLQLYY